MTGRYSLAHRARLTASSQSASIVVRAMTVSTTGSSPKAKELQRRSDGRPQNWLFCTAGPPVPQHQ